jgi:hypothetical protein
MEPIRVSCQGPFLPDPLPNLPENARRVAQALDNWYVRQCKITTITMSKLCEMAERAGLPAPYVWAGVAELISRGYATVDGDLFVPNGWGDARFHRIHVE